MPWPGGENRRGRRASHHEEFEAIRSFLLPCAATGVSLLAVWCLIGATPRGRPWTPAVTPSQGCDGLRAQRIEVLWMFREFSLCRHVHRELLRSVLLNLTRIIPATTCHQRNYVERYSRFNTERNIFNINAHLKGVVQTLLRFSATSTGEKMTDWSVRPIYSSIF
jgi:hypothetical protein